MEGEVKVALGEVVKIQEKPKKRAYTKKEKKPEDDIKKAQGLQKFVLDKMKTESLIPKDYLKKVIDKASEVEEDIEIDPNQLLQDHIARMNSKESPHDFVLCTCSKCKSIRFKKIQEAKKVIALLEHSETIVSKCINMKDEKSEDMKQLI